MAQLYQACQERAYLQFTSNASSHVTNYDCFAVLDNKREELFYRNQTTKETTSVKLKPSLPWLIFMRGWYTSRDISTYKVQLKISNNESIYLILNTEWTVRATVFAIYATTKTW